MRNIKLILVASALFLALFNCAYGQSNEQRRHILDELYKLRDYSIAYDDYSKMYSENKKYAHKKDSIGILYKNQIRAIKYGSQKNKILAFLNNAIERDSALYRDVLGYNYKSYNTLLSSINPRQMPTLLEYFKAVRYSLFEQNKDELLDMKDIPFLKYKKEFSPRLEKVALPNP